MHPCRFGRCASIRAAQDQLRPELARPVKSVLRPFSLNRGTKILCVDLAVLPKVPTTKKKDPILINGVRHDRSRLPNLGEGLGMSTQISIAMVKPYSRTSCSVGTECTENKMRWQFMGNKWFSLIRRQISWRRFLWMKGRWSSASLGSKRERVRRVVRQCGKKCRKAVFRNAILPGFPTTATLRFEPSFLRVCKPTSQELVEHQPPRDGRSRFPWILRIQAFENSVLVRSLLSLARDEIPPHSLSKV